MARLATSREEVARRRRDLERSSPLMVIANRRQRVDELTRALQARMRYDLTLQRARLKGAQARLEGLSPLEVLQRGYAIVRLADSGQIVRSTQQAAPGQALRVRVADGEFGARAE